MHKSLHLIQNCEEMKRAYYFLIFALLGFALLGLIACETEPQETTQGTLYIYADSTVIYANGVDATKFTVTQDGANVTDKSTIYVNASILNGNRFIITTSVLGLRLGRVNNSI